MREREREYPLTFIPSVFVTFTSKAWLFLSKLWRPKVYKSLPLDPSYVQVWGIVIQFCPASKKKHRSYSVVRTYSHLLSIWPPPATRGSTIPSNIVGPEATLEISRSRFPVRMRGSTMTRNGAGTWCGAVEYDVWTPNHTVDTVHHHGRHRSRLCGLAGYRKRKGTDKECPIWTSVTIP